MAAIKISADKLVIQEDGIYRGQGVCAGEQQACRGEGSEEMRR
jgi:hypothetical protein